MTQRSPLSPDVSAERAALLRDRLAILQPTDLEIEDQSHQHAGHAGSRGGASHFRLCITSPRFDGLSRVARQRLVYDALQDLIPFPIHALVLETQVP